MIGREFVVNLLKVKPETRVKVKHVAQHEEQQILFSYRFFLISCELSCSFRSILKLNGRLKSRGIALPLEIAVNEWMIFLIVLFNRRFLKHSSKK